MHCSVVRPSGTVKHGFANEKAAVEWINHIAKLNGLTVVERVDNASTPFIDYILSNDDVYSIHVS